MCVLTGNGVPTDYSQFGIYEEEKWDANADSFLHEPHANCTCYTDTHIDCSGEQEGPEEHIGPHCWGNK